MVLKRETFGKALQNIFKKIIRQRGGRSGRQRERSCHCWFNLQMPAVWTRSKPAFGVWDFPCATGPIFLSQPFPGSAQAESGLESDPVTLIQGAAALPNC